MLISAFKSIFASKVPKEFYGLVATRLKSIGNNSPKFGFSIRKRILKSPTEVQKLHEIALKKAPPKYQKVLDQDCFVVSLVGLPNSGKSTLFNTMLGEYVAITDSIPGMTRDRKQKLSLDGLVKFIDTAGVQPELRPNNNTKLIRPIGEEHQQVTKKQRSDLLSEIQRQTKMACRESHMILFVVDSKKPITPEQKKFALQLLRQSEDKKVVLVMNKCQTLEEEQILGQAIQLGIKHIRVVSGEHGNGVLELMQFIDSQIPEEIRHKQKEKMMLRRQKYQQVKQKLRKQISQLDLPLKDWEKQFDKLNPNPHLNTDLDQDEIDYEAFVRPEEQFATGRGMSQSNRMYRRPIQLAIVGRPNVGKSSLINWLLREDKMVVSQQPHTTTDSIATEFVYQGRRFKLVDTAGLASTNFDRDPEHLKKVQQNTMSVVNQSHVVVYLGDAEVALKPIDFKFIQSILQEGRPVILAINKWEVIKSEYRRKALNFLNSQLEKKLGDINGQTTLTISVKTHEGIDKVMEEVLRVYEKWNTRVSTGMLNDWPTKFKKLQELPKEGQTELKIKFFVQAKVRPPTFIAFVNDPGYAKTNYTRFLKHNLSEEFGLKGVPIRLHYIKAKSESNKPETKKKHAKSLSKTAKQRQAVKQKLKTFKQRYGNFGSSTTNESG